MALEEFSFVMLADKVMDRRTTAAWIRSSLEKVGLARFGLATMAHAVEYWETTSELLVAGGAILGQAHFAEVSGDPGWAMSLHALRYEQKASVVGSVPVWPFYDDGRSEVWSWLSELLGELVVAANADACFVTGAATAGEDERFPSDAEILPSIPAAFTVWNYLGPSRLTPTIREGLRVLPAFVSRPLGEGWLLRPVADYGDALPEGFQERYAKLCGGNVEFLRANAKLPRPARKKAKPRR